MERIKRKRLKFKTLTGFTLGSLLLIIAVASPLFVYVPTAHAVNTVPAGGATTAPPPITWSHGSASMTIAFIDSSHIAVSASGNYSFQDGQGTEVVDLSGLQGLYYGASTSPYYKDHYAPSGKYWYSNGQSSTCPGHNTDIDIISYAPGKVRVRINPWLPAAPSSAATTGQCEAVKINGNSTSINLNINDQNIGSAIKTFQANGTGFPQNLKLSNPTNSTVMFYKNGNEIDASTIDSSLNTGNNGKYRFALASGSTYKEQGDNGSGCTSPDTITLPGNSSGLAVTADYTYHTSSSCKAYHYKVLVLGETPEAAFSTVTGASLPTNGNNTATTTPQCSADVSGITTVINFFMCPVIQWLWNTVNWADAQITSMMTVDVRGIFDAGNCGNASSSSACTATAYYIIWNSFRILATAILIIGGLIMVISEALGFQVLDAYTIRKVLPRLVVAAIGISLSWPLMRLFVSFFDTLGTDVQGLMYAPFAHFGAGVISPATTTMAALFSGGALLLLGFTSLTFLLGGVLILATTFIVLVARQIVITILVILAPIAIACYILPGTQRVWKLWFDTFFGLMAIFPIYEIIVAAGHIAAAITLLG